MCRYNQVVHTTGHAYLTDLKRLLETFKPTTVIPIHRLASDKYDKHFEGAVRKRIGVSP